MRTSDLRVQACNSSDPKFDQHRTSCSGAFETDLHYLQEITLRCNRNSEKTSIFRAWPHCIARKTAPVAGAQTGWNRFLKTEKTTEEQNPRNIWVPGVLKW